MLLTTYHPTKSSKCLTPTPIEFELLLRILPPLAGTILPYFIVVYGLSLTSLYGYGHISMVIDCHELVSMVVELSLWS